MDNKILTKAAATDEVLNREYKDSVFRLIFGEKDKLIELANALFDTEYTLDTPLDINTIEEAIYDVMKNDLSFIIDDKYIILSEHQSTFNPNMPTRSLIYYGELLKDYLNKISRIDKNRNIYASTLVKIPRPTFIVLYNGKTPLPPESKMEIKDAYLGDGENALNLTVKVYNVNKDAGCSLLEKCPTLYQYSLMIQMIRDHMKQGQITHSIVQEIVRTCIERGILVDFMKKYGTRGIEILCKEMTVEEAKTLSYEAGIEQGIEQGENNIIRLHQRLMEQNRMEDLKRSLEDEEYRRQLLRELFPDSTVK